MPKQLKIMTVSWWALVQTVGPFLLLNLAALAIWGTVHFMSAAPPPAYAHPQQRSPIVPCEGRH